MQEVLFNGKSERKRKMGVTEAEIKRINELYNKSRLEGLTDEEKTEQKLLRGKYIASVRENVRGQLERIRIVDENGKQSAPERNKNVTAVIFDMDGVIFDSERLFKECWEEVGAAYGFHDIGELCLECTGITDEETKKKVLEKYGEDIPYDEYKKECSKLFHKKCENGGLPIKPGIKELLSYLKEKGITRGLASSTREETVKRELAEAGLISYFNEIICGDMVKNSKPAPDIYLKACEELGVKADERVIAIEDSYNGIRSASSAGLKTIMVPDLLPPNEEIEKLVCAVLKDLNNVKEYIEEIL